MSFAFVGCCDLDVEVNPRASGRSNVSVADSRGRVRFGFPVEVVWILIGVRTEIGPSGWGVIQPLASSYTALPEVDRAMALALR